MKTHTRLSNIRFSYWLLALGLCLCAMTRLHAQATTATVLGTVTDMSGAAVPDAAVQVKNVGTGIVQNSVSDSQGRYRVPDLVLGEYEVQASKNGFQTVVRKGIVLNVGSEPVIDFALPVGQSQQTVTVEAEVSQVETTSAAVGNLVEATQMRDLPLNGRSYTSLLALAPGVQTANQPVQTVGSDFYGRGAQFSVAGSRLYGQAYLIDNTDVSNFFGHSVGSGSTGTALGVDAIAEFQTLTATYSAQFGGNGAVLNAISKSGTNSIHGSGYEFFRNNVLDARDYFDPPSQPNGNRNPTFRRNQFGGTLSGPVKKDKAFFFVNYEGLRQEKGISSKVFVPDANARNGFLPCAVVTGIACGANGLANVGFANLSVRNTVQLYPAVATVSPTGAAPTFVGTNQIANENYLLGRFDYTFSEKDSMFARYVLDRADFSFAPNIPLWTENDTSRNHIATVEERHIFSPNLVNLARVSFVRPAEIGVYNPATATAPDGSHPMQFYPGTGIQDGNVAVTGLVTLGTNGNLPVRVIPNRFDEGDDVLWTLGAHSLKFGVLIDRAQNTDRAGFRQTGYYTFTGLQQFFQGTPSLVNANIPGQFNNLRYFRELWIAPYVQDDWKVTARLTVNVGLRYTWGANPSEAANNLYQAPNPRASATFVNVPNVWATNPNTKNFDPRIGIAYDVFGDHKTSIRAGFGIFHELLKAGEGYQATYALSPPLFTTIAAVPIPGLCTPSYGAFIGGGTGAANLACPQLASVTQGYDYNTTTSPYVMQYNFSVQRDLGGGNVLTVGYIGSQGRHLWYNTDLNAPLPNTPAANLPATAVCGLFSCVSNGRITANVRPNPALSYMVYFQTVANSNYNSLQVSLNHRFSHHFQEQISYTFSKSLDQNSSSLNLEAAGGIGNSTNPFNRGYDHGPSGFDRRHNFTANTVFEIPFNKNKLISGWELSGLLTAVSGAPFSPSVGFDNEGIQAPTITGSERPNIAPGCNASSAILSDPQRWFNPACFTIPAVGTPGNLGRNVLTGPGLFNLDFSVLKNTKIGERTNVQFRAEFFNVLNHPNFNLPTATTFSQSGGVLSTAGVVTTTTTFQRQIQFGLKVIF